MKVLNVVPLLNVNLGGGTTERTIQMSYFLAENNISCEILTLDVNILEDTRKYLSKVKISSLPCLLKRFLIPAPLFTQVSLSVQKADIVHLMNHWTLLNVWVYFLCKKYKKKYVLCPAGSLIVFGRSKILKRIFSFVIGNKMLRDASGFIAITEEEKKHFNSIGISEEKVVVIPNGIQPPFSFKAGGFKEKFHLLNKKIILYVGRLNPIKGPDILLDAFIKVSSSLSDYHLVFAGPDEGMLSSLTERVKKAELGARVHFVGFLSGESKYEAYFDADFLAIPSRSEAMSIVVLEAGIVGTPSVFTDQCGLNYFEKENIGKVVPVSVDGFESGLIAMLEKDFSKEIVSARLKSFIERNFLWNNIIAKYVTYYDFLLKEVK